MHLRVGGRRGRLSLAELRARKSNASFLSEVDLNKLMTGKLLLGATVALFGNIAWGQQMLIANIPFGFRTAGTTLPSGKYEIVTGLGTSTDMARLYNVESKKAILVVFNGPVYQPVNGSTKPARLVFRCGEAGCALAEVWPSSTSQGWRLHQPRISSRPQEELSTVTLPMLAANKQGSDARVR
jgi:hypothetical protein